MLQQEFGLKQALNPTLNTPDVSCVNIDVTQKNNDSKCTPDLTKKSMSSVLESDFVLVLSQGGFPQHYLKNMIHITAWLALPGHYLA